MNVWTSCIRIRTYSLSMCVCIDIVLQVCVCIDVYQCMCMVTSRVFFLRKQNHEQDILAYSFSPATQYTCLVQIVCDVYTPNYYIHTHRYTRALAFVLGMLSPCASSPPCGLDSRQPCARGGALPPPRAPSSWQRWAAWCRSVSMRAKVRCRQCLQTPFPPATQYKCLVHTRVWLKTSESLRKLMLHVHVRVKTCSYINFCTPT